MSNEKKPKKTAMTFSRQKMETGKGLLKDSKFTQKIMIIEF